MASVVRDCLHHSQRGSVPCVPSCIPDHLRVPALGDRNTDRATRLQQL